MNKLEYLKKCYNDIKEKGFIFEDKSTLPFFTYRQLEYMFNRGYEYMLFKLPKLKWIQGCRNDISKEYKEEYYAITPFGVYSIMHWNATDDYTLYFENQFVKANMEFYSDAMEVADEDYRKKLEEAVFYDNENVSLLQ